MEKENINLVKEINELEESYTKLSKRIESLEIKQKEDEENLKEEV
jgi:hypothetical protein